MSEFVETNEQLMGRCGGDLPIESCDWVRLQDHARVAWSETVKDSADLMSVSQFQRALVKIEKLGVECKTNPPTP